MDWSRVYYTLFFQNKLSNMLLPSVLYMLSLLGGTSRFVGATTVPFVDPRPTGYYTVTSLVQPSDVILTYVVTYTAWLSTVTVRTTEPCVSLVEVSPGVTGWIIMTSYQLTSYPVTRSTPIVFTSSEYEIAWTTISSTTTTTTRLCSATLVVSSVLATTTILETVGTAVGFLAYTTVPGLCTYTSQRPVTTSTTRALPPGEGTVFTTTELYTSTYTSYVSFISFSTITNTQTRCINPTVTITTPSTVTTSTWPAGTTTMTSFFRCRVRGTRVPPIQRGIGPIFRWGGPPIPGLWPPFPIPGLLPTSTTATTRDPDVPEITQTYTRTERNIVMTVTRAPVEKSTAWRTACAETSLTSSASAVSTTSTSSVPNPTS